MGKDECCIADDEDAETDEPAAVSGIEFMKSQYGRAARALSRVESVLSGALGGAPSEAIEALSLAQCEIRTCVLEVSGGNVDCSTSGDLTPLFAFILVRSSIAHPSTCAELLRGALADIDVDHDQDIEKFVDILYSAVQYVTSSVDTTVLASSAS